MYSLGICTPIAEGTKQNNENAMVVPWLNFGEGETKKTFHCEPIYILCAYDENYANYFVDVRYSAKEGQCIYCIATKILRVRGELNI